LACDILCMTCFFIIVPHLKDKLFAVQLFCLHCTLNNA